MSSKLWQNPVPAEGKYPDHIAQTLREAITNVGGVLLKNLAVLLPEVYYLFVREAFVCEVHETITNWLKLL